MTKEFTPASWSALNNKEFKKEFCTFWQISEPTYSSWKLKARLRKGKGFEKMYHNSSLRMLFKFRKQTQKDYTLENLTDLFLKL